MRPPREDIAAPPFPPGLEWIGGPEPRLGSLVASGPLLVHFFDFAQLNSVRALPYVTAWHERYADDGLGVLGVHSPRLSLSRDRAAVESALPGLGIDWPVALDAELRAFRDYGCRGWPSLFLWGRGGVLRWYHLGEGEYRATEEAIREQLAPDRKEEWPPLLEPLRPSDAPGAQVIAPTPELFPGGDQAEPWRPSDGSDTLELCYAAAGVYAAAEGEGTLTATLDDGTAAGVEVNGPGLYELSSSDAHREQCLWLHATPGIAIHSVQYAPGPRRG